MLPDGTIFESDDFEDVTNENDFIKDDTKHMYNDDTKQMYNDQTKDMYNDDISTWNTGGQTIKTQIDKNDDNSTIDENIFLEEINQIQMDQTTIINNRNKFKNIL